MIELFQSVGIISGKFLKWLSHSHQYEEIPRPYYPNRPISRGGVVHYKCTKCGQEYSKQWKAF